MSDKSPIIVWFRRDLRLADHPALEAACSSGRPVIPVFILDEVFEDYGAAPKFRMHHALESFAASLKDKDSRLVLRRGKALEVLRKLVEETGAGAVTWSRLYEPEAIERDKAVKSALKEDGLEVTSHAGHVLFEPPTVETKEGGPYKVYSPFWRAVRDRDVAGRISPPGSIPAPGSWPASDSLGDWKLTAAMRRGADVVAEHLTVGESAASSRLGAFVAHKLDAYKDGRDQFGEDAASGLSENLTWGEIAPAAIWHSGQKAMEEGKKGAEHFLKELVWRDFAYHLAFHMPRLTTSNWREEWDAFPWSKRETKAVTHWKQGRTGIPLVDAAMREMYVTGRMHNRGRMLVASWLTKNLMTHWQIGQKWFEDCLIDWDPASNALGWQWTAGSGPDAAPYFRIFNPVTQEDKFDADGTYRRRWIAEGNARPTKTALSYFDAIPKSWEMSPDDAYPEPEVTPKEGREKALDAYENRDF